jgi:site-specific recombinase XerD
MPDAAVLGYLARYSSPGTVTAYTLDLRLLFEWCARQGLDVFKNVERPHLELFARYLESERHNAPATIHRRLLVVRSFYQLAEFDGYIKKSPATHLRLPRVFKDETKTLGLDRNELGSMVYAARASTPSDSALITMLAMLGLRVSEACNVRIENTHGELRGHRTLSIIGKGTKPATIPLAIPVARAMDLAAGDRTEGWLCLRADGKQMDRRAASRVVVRIAKSVGIKTKISPHSLRHSYITACLDAGVPLRDVQVAARHNDIRMTVRYDRARGNLDRHANYAVASFIAGAA